MGRQRLTLGQHALVAALGAAIEPGAVRSLDANASLAGRSEQLGHPLILTAALDVITRTRAGVSGHQAATACSP
jgi:hypothetical protein